MAIATEIGRLQGAKQDLISRLKAKGVSVPENATLEEITPLIDNIDVGDPVLQEKTVTPTTTKQTVTPDSNYDGLSKVTVNAMPTATQATPSITVSSAGLITAKATQSAGYVASGTKSATKQLTVQAAKTVTPSTSSQTAVASGRYTTGAVTVAGDANLVASNIKSGVSIFGVIGTYEGSGGSSSGSGSGGTCNVTMVIPANVCVFGYGTGTIVVEAMGATLPISIPSTAGNVHMLPFNSTWNFENIPIGSVFTFYSEYGITGASVSDTIDFSLANHLHSLQTTHLFAVCRCNGDGEITIKST